MSFTRLLMGLALFIAVAALSPPRLIIYDSPHYTIHTDLGPEAAREAALRMTKMFEEYQHRTSAFTVKIHEKLPFYLYRHQADYIAAGGLLGSIGVFTGDRLMAYMKDDSSWKIVHVVVATLNSFLARAASQNQTFESADDFFQQASAGNLRAHPQDWLPRSLLTAALQQTDKAGTWSLTNGPRPRLICVTTK